MTDLTEDQIEAYQTVAQSDLPISWFAQALLEAKGIPVVDRQRSEGVTVRPKDTPTVGEENEGESVFAF